MNKTRKQLQREIEDLKLLISKQKIWPEKCPITRRNFFMEIDGLPTYGGPYDSYTIPEMGGEPTDQWHERELYVRRYDHDRGHWVDNESIPLRIIYEDYLFDFMEAYETISEDKS